MIGDLLRKTREEKNLSLTDIEKETNIRKLYIKAIEDGDYGKLPGEVFLKGFIKTYAKFLGLDGQALVNQYKAEKNGSSAPAAAAPQKAPADSTAPENSDAAQAEKPAQEEKAAEAKVQPKDTADHPSSGKVSILHTNSEEYLKPQNSGSKKNIIIVIVIIAAIIAAAAIYLSSQSSDAPKPTTPPAASSEPAAQNQPQAQNQQPAVVSGVEVSAVFSQDCWTEVKVDGTVVLSETVKAGSSLNWKGNQQIDVTVGNAGAADFTFNGQSAGKLGAEGAVVSKTFALPNAAGAQQPQQ